VIPTGRIIETPGDPPDCEHWWGGWGEKLPARAEGTCVKCGAKRRRQGVVDILAQEAVATGNVKPGDCWRGQPPYPAKASGTDDGGRRSIILRRRTIARRRAAPPTRAQVALGGYQHIESGVHHEETTRTQPTAGTARPSVRAVTVLVARTGAAQGSQS